MSVNVKAPEIEGLGGGMVEGLFQPMHLLVIFFIALLVFGPKNCPNLAKVWGKASAL